MATKPVVQIDGKNFVAVPQGRSERVVRRLRNEDFISQFSGEGIRSPSTFLGYQTLIFPNFSLGLGRERIDSDSARVSGEYRRFWDATCDTRFASGTYLPILEEDSTSTGLEVIRASASFKGNLWGIWEDDTGRSIKSRKYVGSSTTWTAGGTLFTSPAIDATSSGETASAPLTFAHTVSNRNNRALIVAVGTLNDAPTGITWHTGGDEQDLTQLGTNASGSADVSIWYLASPNPGTANVVISAGGSGIQAGAISFYEVLQSSVLSNFISADLSSGVSGGGTVTTVASDMAVDVARQGGTGSATIGAGQTEFLNHDIASVRGVASYERATDTTTVMTWTMGGDAAWAAARVNGYLTVPLDIIAHKTNLLALTAGYQSHSIHRSTDGVTWTAPTTPVTGDLLSTTITQSVDSDLGLLSEIGGEAVAALYHEDNSVITFFSSADGGAVWADEAVDISSTNGPQGIATMAGIDNEDKLYVGTREGLHEVDTAPSTWTTRLIFPMISNNDNCRRMKVMDDGALWFAQGVDDSTPPIVYRMFVSNGARVIERVPNDFSLGDGVTSDALGSIRWMESAGGMVYVSATGGAASRNARIWAHNGKGWHSVRQHDTANRKIQWIAASSDDDGTPRLHYAIRSTNTVGVYTTSTHFLGQAFVNPASGVTIKRETPGFVDLPYVDLSFPLDIKNWLRVGVNADTLASGTGNQHINMDYGITSDLGSLTARNGGDLGNILSGTSRLSFGTNAIGASGLVLGLRANMLLGSAANTVKPVLKDIQIDALPKPTKTRRFEVIVDIADTAALRGGANATAAIYTDLETIEDLKVKAAVTYADIGTKYMDVEAVHYDDEITGHSATGGPDSNARRGGTAQIILSEVAI